MPEAPKVKTLRFDFFRVVLPENSKRSFEQMLSDAKARTALEERLRVKQEVPHRWEFLEKHADGLWTGDMTRIRDDVVPNKASRTKPRQRMSMQSDEGPTEDTVFLYDTGRNVLMVQSNRFGISAYDIVDYFMSLSGVKGQHDAALVLSSQGAAELETFQEFDKIAVKVALPNRGPIPKTGLRSLDSNIDMASEAGARYFDLTLGVGTAKAKMLKEVVLKTVASISKLGSGKGKPLKRLVVTGLTADDRHEAFDLLANRLHATADAVITLDRDLPYETRRSAALAAHRSCSQELTKLFPNDEQEEP